MKKAITIFKNKAGLNKPAGIVYALVIIYLMAGTVSNAQQLKVNNGYLKILSGTIVKTGGGVTLQNAGSIDNSGTLTTGGDWTNNANGLINASPGTVEFNGSAAQTIGGTSATVFFNLLANNAAGMNLDGDQTINSTLNFIAGKINTAGNTLIMGNASATTGAGTGQYINGNLQINFAAGPAQSRLFAIGDNTIYAPVLLSAMDVTKAGNLTAATQSGTSPNENNPVTNASGVNQSAKANRYWNVDADGVFAITSANAAFGFDAAEATGTPASYLVRKFDSPSTWSAPTTGSQSATSTEATGLTSFSEFQVGEPNVITVATDPTDVTICENSGTSFSISSSSSPAASIRWQENSGSGFNDITDGGIYSGANTNMLIISTATAAMDNYQYRAVISNINGSANSAAATLTIGSNATVDVGGAVAAICQGETTEALGGSFSGGATSAIWSDNGAGGTFANNDGSTPGLATYTASALSGSPVTLTLTTSGSCGIASASKDVIVNVPVQYFADADGDGYGDANDAGTLFCSDPGSGYSTDNSDCNDNDATVHAPQQYYIDADGDGYGSAITAMLCSSTAPTGYSTQTGDCDDNNPAINPGAVEICGNGIDDNCNGQIDENCGNKHHISILDETKYEGNGHKTMSFTVRLKKQSKKTVKVSYSTQDITAIAGADYVAQTGKLIFEPGVKTQKIIITLICDKVPEPDETFKVVLSHAAHALIADSVAIGTILNDDTTSTGAVIAISGKTINQGPFLKISPNPASSVLNVQLYGYSGNIALQLCSIEGRVVRKEKINISRPQLVQQQIDVAGLSSGIYLLNVIDEKGYIRTEKVMVSK